MHLVTVLGIIGSCANIVMLMPQARATWLHRHDVVELRAMSWMTYAVISLQAFVWMMYAYLERDVWVGLPTLVNLPIALWTTCVVYRAHRADHDGLGGQI